jgi:outer membrane protein with beta-barrel domain
MMKSLLPSTTLAFVLTVPAVTAAQPAPSSPSCPPGSWFCAEAPQQHATPAGQPLEPLPDPDAPVVPPSREAHSAPSHTSDSAPPVVVYQPPPPVMVVPPEAPGRYEYTPPRRPPLFRAREWGLNAHVEGAMIGGPRNDTGMGGAGVGLRFKPLRAVGIEADVDFVGGHDYQGYSRGETAFTLNGLVFLNPRSRAQIYLLAGFGWSGAHVTCDRCMTAVDGQYSYFGGQIGAGLEVRLNQTVAFDFDLRGFVRGRTDQAAQAQAEFVDTGCASSSSTTCRTTNASGGGLLTGGLTLYF